MLDEKIRLVVMLFSHEQLEWENIDEVNSDGNNTCITGDRCSFE